jgi:CRISPR-associated protein Cas2
MTLLIVERVTPSVRGDLSRWLLEVQAGVFVGRVSRRVREALWDRAVQRADGGSVLMLWRARTEQGFDLRTHRPRGRVPRRHEGVWLVEVVDYDPDREP